MKNTAIALAIATTLAAGAITPALAGESKSIEVSYADLDLTSDADRNELEQRIDRAARKICDVDGHGTGARIATKDARTCYAEARRKSDAAYATILKSERLGG